MILGVHFRDDFPDGSVPVDDEGGAHDAHVSPAVHLFLCPHAVGFQYLFVGVGDEVEREVNFAWELAESGLTPTTSNPLPAREEYPSFRLQASAVHPDVLSFG